MTMFKMNPMYSGDASMCVVAGSAVFTNTTTPTSNTIIPAQVLPVTPAANGAAIGQGETVAPMGCKVTVVVNPTTAYHPAVAANASSAAVALIDLRAYPSDIVSVHVGVTTIASATPGTLSLSLPTANVVGIDQTNKFVYVYCSQQYINSLALHYAVFFKDSYAP
jgi:hypothetical protein